MENNNSDFRRVFGVIILLAFGGIASQVNATDARDDYAFMSAQDLYDALSQDSQIARGYLLGIVDAKKGPQDDGSCFAVPWQADADQVIVEAYLEYWPDVVDFSKKAPDELINMMRLKFPCSSQ
jgi:hypothetical protein